MDTLDLEACNKIFFAVFLIFEWINCFRVLKDVTNVQANTWHPHSFVGSGSSTSVGRTVNIRGGADIWPGAGERCSGRAE